MTDTFRILFIGDFHFGENYAGRSRRLKNLADYLHPTSHLQPFIKKSDYTVINLETPLVLPSQTESPFQDTKPYVHWSDPELAGEALTRLGVDAVSLANNHALDYGVDGMHSTIATLNRINIKHFGAGEDILHASQPLTVNIPKHHGGGQVHVHSAYDYRTSYEDRFQYYATNTRPGCNPLRLRDHHNLQIPDSLAPDFNIAFPHWGANYKWPTTRQKRQATFLASAGYDFVIGHGSHCLQAINVQEGVPIVESIGNGLFLSRGRFSKYVKENSILPYAAWTFFEIKTRRGRRQYSAKLYPVYSDNVKTDYQPKPVSATDFDSVYASIIERTPTIAVEALRLSREHDELGHYISIQVPSLQ